LLLIVGAWNFLNLIIAGAALGVISEKPRDVAGIELDTKMDVELTFGQHTIQGTVTRASSTGATITIPKGAAHSLRRGDYGRLTLKTPPQGLIITSLPTAVAIQPTLDQQSLVLKFSPEAHHYPAIAELILSDLGDVRRARRAKQKRRNILVGTGVLFRWALVNPFIALSLALTGGSSAGRRIPARTAPANNNTVKPVLNTIKAGAK
jgi:cellulose synthase (UDP-forming)